MCLSSILLDRSFFVRVTLSYHWTSTRSILEEVRRIVYGHPGVQITVDKEASGPPAGPPISISFVGEDFDKLIALQKEAKKIILMLVYKVLKS